jgi:hypothetical protein
VSATSAAGAQTPAPAAPAAPAAAQPSAAPAPTAEPASAPAAQPTLSADEIVKLQQQIAALEARVGELEQARVNAEVESLSQATAVPEPDKFSVYGFADFGVNHAWLGEHSFLRGLVNGETTFVLGNLNLYFDFKPDPSWQVLTEVRLTEYPHGVEESLATPLGGEYVRTSTEVTDIASTATASGFRWGGIVIERAYADWSYDERFNVRVGQFLTPYGIWNVDHGTPTLIALMMPHFVSSEVFPAHQLGVDLHGAFLDGGWELGYDAYLSNGRTATQLDFTGNKAFGGRLRASRIAPLPLTLGTSFYYGQIDDISKSIVSFDPFKVDRQIILDATEWGVGADVSLDIDALRIRTEGILHEIRYEPGKREARRGTAPGSLTPDNNEYDAYLLFAYRLPVLGLEPFAYGEYNHFVSPYGDDQSVLGLGLNIYFTSFASLKTEVARVLFFDIDFKGDNSFSDNDMTLLFTRLAVAF